jgi:hypothetical protein
MAETVLGARKRERWRIHIRQKKALKDFHYRGKKGDGSIGGTKVKRLAGLGDRDDVGGFPDGGEVSRINR